MLSTQRNVKKELRPPSMSMRRLDPQVFYCKALCQCFVRRRESLTSIFRESMPTNNTHYHRVNP